MALNNFIFSMRWTECKAALLCCCKTRGLGGGKLDVACRALIAVTNLLAPEPQKGICSLTGFVVMSCQAHKYRYTLYHQASAFFLAFPDPDKPSELVCDALGFGPGVVLCISTVLCQHYVSYACVSIWRLFCCCLRVLYCLVSLLLASLDCYPLLTTCMDDFSFGGTTHIYLLYDVCS